MSQSYEYDNGNAKFERSLEKVSFQEKTEHLLVPPLWRKRAKLFDVFIFFSKRLQVA